MDGEEDRDILPARTSSKPADTADQEINLDQKQTRPEETNRSKRRSILYGLDRSLDDLELDEDDDQERRPPRRDADNSRRKRKKSSVVNDANVAHDSNEPDSCRICSFPAEPDNLLYHPCKCSGTIKYVHQDCLKSWLDTSRRTRCDVCHHLYTFKKEYSSDMPSTLPVRILVGPMLKHTTKWARIALRVLFVGTIWLAVLPAMTYWCWRVGFWLSDYVSLRVSGQLYYLELYSAQLRNGTNLDPNFVMPSTSFSSSLSESLLQAPTESFTAIPSVTSAQDPLVSAFESLQSIIQQQPTGTNIPTPHPSSSAIASAFSQLASVLQSGNYISRRTPRFKPRRSLSDGQPMTTVFDVVKKAVLFITGKPLFEQDSSLWLDMLLLPYYTCARLGGWIIYIPQLLYKNSIGVLLASMHSNNSTTSSLQRFVEDMSVPIVSGQLIAICIVIAFVALFFLREWVLANAEGMFGDEQRVADAQRNGQDGAQNGAANPGQNDVPGAFPQDAPRIDELDIDMGFAEPRPPSPNIIPLEEQEALMKEVIERRKMRERELSKKGAVVQQWQWGKREEILEEWRERKIQELQLKGRVGTPKPELPVQSESALDQERAFDGNDTEIESEVHWDRLGYGDMDPQPEGGVAVEHIEHSPVGDSVEQGASQFLFEDPATAIAAPTLAAEPAKTVPLVSPEHSVDGRTATGSSAYENALLIEAFEINSTPFLPDDHSSPPAEASRLPRATLSITNLIPASTTASEPSSSPFSLFSKVTSSTNVASDKERAEDLITKPSHSSSPQLPSPSQDEEGIQENDIVEVTLEKPLSTSLPSDHRPELPSMIQNPRRKTPPSVFATLVPPTPPSMRPTELPFSIRGYNISQSGLWSQKRAESFMGTSSRELDTKAYLGSRPVLAAESPVERTNSTPSSDHEASGSEGFHPKSRTTFTQLSVPRPRSHGKWPSPKQSRRFSPSRSPKNIISPIPRHPNGARDMPPSDEQNIQSLHKKDHPHNPYTHPTALYFVDPSLVPSSTPALVSIDPSSEDSVMMPSSSKTGPLSAPLPGRFYPGSISAPITPGEKAGLRQFPDMVYQFEAMTPAASQIRGDAFLPSTFLPEGQRHRPSSSVDGVYGPSGVTSRPAGAPLPMHPFDRTGKVIPRGHSMNMGMSSVIDFPTQSGSRAHRLPRTRALTAGGDREFMQRQLNSKSDTLTFSHQRSSSLSSHTSTSNYFRSDDTQLLGHERHQASPIPWYGFPDPRPELERERKKLKEWEQTEMRRIYVPQSHKRAEKNAVLVQGTSEQESKSTSPEQPVDSLVLQPIEIQGEKSTSSGVEEVIVPKATGDTDNAASMKGMDQIVAPEFDDCHVESNDVAKSGHAEKSLPDTLTSTSSICDLKVKAEIKDEAEPIFPPELSKARLVEGSADQQSDISPPHSGRPDAVALINHRDATVFSDSISLTTMSGPTRIAPIASSSAVLSTSKLRAAAPGSIILPSQPNFEETMKSLKRPGLPLATSPISVDDRSPGTMALYQAPEELHTQTQGDQQAMVAGSSTRALDANPILFQIPAGLPEPPEPEVVQDNAGENDMDQDLRPDNMDGAGVGEAAAPAEDVWEDDWAHMLEVVGVVGPWYHIVQNAALVMVIFNVTLGVGVFLPYVMGRTTSLVVVEPSAILQRLSLLNDNPSFLGLQLPPLWTSDRSISIIGKGFSYVFGDLVSSLGHTANATLRLLGSTWNGASNQTIDPQAISNVPTPHSFDIVYRIWSMIRPTAIISNGFDSILHAIRWYQQKSSCTMGLSPSSSFGNILAFVDYAICSFYPDVVKTSPEFRTVLRHWLRYIFQLVATERISAIIFGYMVTLCGLALHSTLSNQHGPYMVFTLLKVGSFVILETIGRPLAFGFAIDLFTLSLFPNTTIQSRLAFLRIAPYSSLLQHWLIGNVVIIQFVRALDDLHRFLRPGAMWHVRHLVDPSPPSIRDLITKSIPWHITKLFATISSGTCLLWLLLGLVLDLNNFLTSNFAPLRWNLRQPSSDVPLDLVLLNIFIPATFRFLKLKKLSWTMAKTFIVEWSKYLNLQNVLFDEIAVPAPIDTTDGTFWRVPVTAGAIQLAGKPYAIETDVTGNGITQEGRDLIDLQLLASEKAMRNPNHDYRVIFYPHNFQARLAAFVIISWFAFFGAVWTAVTLPICVGRLAFKHLLHTTAVHDAHSWIAGLYIFWFVNFGRYLVAREIRRWSKYLAEPNHRFAIGLFLTHTMTMLGRLSFAVVVLIFILPTLIGLLVEVYFVLPLWYHLYPRTTPTLRVVDAWVAGLTICALILRAARLGRPGRLLTLFDRIRRDGWFKIKTRALVSQLTLIAAALVTLILSPFILELVLPAHIARDLGAGHVVLKIFLPMLFALFISSLLATTLHGMLVLWVEAIRDEKFLTREIIENFETTTTVDSILTDDHDSIVP